MTESNNKFNIKKILWYLVFAAIFAFIIPIIFQILNASDVTKIEFIIFGFDMIFSVLIGLYAGSHHDSWIPLLFFPVMFFVTAKSFFLGPLRFIAVIYLAASLLAYGAKK